MVQPMQMPPTLGQPPMPPIQPRLPTLHWTTGPQQPSFTMHLRRCRTRRRSRPARSSPPRSQPSCTVWPNSQVGRSCSSSGIIGAVPGRLVEQVEQRLHEVVRLDRAAGHVDDRQPAGRPPVPAQVVGQAHAPGRVAGHGVDAAVGRARAGGDHGPGLRGQPVDPVAGRDRLAGRRVGAERRPSSPRPCSSRWGSTPRPRARTAPSSPSAARAERFEEVVAVLVGEHGVVQVHLGQAGDGAEDDVLDARLGGGGDGDRVAVAAQAGGDPEDVDLLGQPRRLSVPCRTPPRFSRSAATAPRPSSVTTRSPPTACRRVTIPGCSATTSPMIAALAAERVRPHRREQPLGVVRRARRRSACPRWRRRAGRARASRRRPAPRAQRDRRLVSFTPTLDAAASSLQALDSPPRVGSRMHRIAGHASSIDSRQAVQRGGVALQDGLELDPLAHRHDGDAVVADRARRRASGRRAGRCGSTATRPRARRRCPAW